MAEHKGFFLYLDQYAPIEDLTLEQKGKLLEAMFAYNSGLEAEILDPEVKIAFKFFKQTFERDKQRYEDKCAKMRDNAIKKQKQANATNCNQEDADASNCNQKQANGDNNKNNSKNNSKNNKKEKEEGEAGEPAAPPDVDPELLDFARQFQNEVTITHGNTAPKITDALIVDGALELERAVRIDGLEINEIKLALMWAVHDDFWGQNLKSMARMRTKTKAGVTKIQSAIGEYRRHAGRSNENRDRWAGAI